MAISRFQMNRQLRANGGIMSPDVGVSRQGYFLGKLVKKFKDDIIPNELKSPTGVAAALTAANFAPKFIPGGSDQTLLQRFLPSVSGALGTARGAVSDIFKGIGGGSNTDSERVIMNPKEVEEGAEPVYQNFPKKGDGLLKTIGKGLTTNIPGTEKSLAGLLMTPQALALGSGLLAGAFTKDKEDPIYTGQDVGLNLQDIAKLANISDPKTAAAIGLRFSPDVESRKFSPEEMAATYAANQERDFTEQREQAEDGGIMGGLDQEDFDKFLEDMKQRDMGAMQDQIMRDFKKYMERKKMIENLPEARDGGIMKMAEGGLTKYEVSRLKGLGYNTKGGTVLEPFGGLKVLRDILKVNNMAKGGIATMAEGGMMDMGGNEMDLRGGGFVPMGEAERADDVPARLSKNEFVFTADAVRAAGGGNVDKGADKMYATMKKLEDRVA